MSVDVRGWGVADGAVALLTEASAQVTGGVRQLRVSGRRLYWSQPAESVQLLELAPEQLQRSSLYACAAAAAPRPDAQEKVSAAIAAARPRRSPKADAGSCGDDGTCAEDGTCADDGTCAADADATCAEAATFAAHRDTSSRSSPRSSRSSSRSGRRSKLAAQCDAASASLPSAPPGWPSLKRPAAFHPHRPVTCGSRPQRLFSFDLSPLRGDQAVGAAAFVLLELHGQAFEGGATALVLYADSGRAGEEPRPLGSWRRSDQPCSDQGRCSGTLLRKSQLTIDITDAAHGLARLGTERARRLDVLASCEHERGKRARSSRASVKAAALRVLHTPLRD